MPADRDSPILLYLMLSFDRSRRGLSAWVPSWAQRKSRWCRAWEGSCLGISKENVDRDAIRRWDEGEQTRWKEVGCLLGLEKRCK